MRDGRGRRRARWAGYVVANGVVGAVAGASWPFVYFMAYAIGVRLGWVVDDPTVTEDGIGLLIGLGVAVLVVVASAFAAVNLAVARWTHVPARRVLPAGLAVCLVVALAVATGLYH